MNYFEFFDLPVRFSVDMDLVRQKFLENSRNFHPDFAIAKGMDAMEALEKSAQNNKAFKVLQDDALRRTHILELHDLLGNEKEQLPMEFLMEMMEINEQIAELEFDFDPNTLEKLKREYKTLEAGIQAELSRYQTQFDTDKTGLEKVKEFHLKSKYILRIKKSIDTFAAR